MKYFRAGIVFTPDKTDSHLEAKPYMKLGKAKTKVSGRQTDPRPRGERIQIKLAGTTERAVSKAIKASGHQFVVRDRDGHPRGAFATAEEAEAAAGETDTVFDRIEGRNINRRKRNDDIPDPGVYTAQVSEQWTIGRMTYLVCFFAAIWGIWYLADDGWLVLAPIASLICAAWCLFRRVAEV